MKTIVAILIFLPLYSLAQTDSAGRVANPNYYNPVCCCYNQNYVLVERPRTMSIITGGGQIFQSGETIGNYTTHFGADINTLESNITLPGGTPVAFVITSTISHTATIFTVIDHGSHTISIQNTAFPEEEIALYLSNRFYL